MTRIAYCTFHGSYKEYAYYCPFANAKPGMDAIVDTPSSGLTRVKIVQIRNSETSMANKPLVALVDDKTEKRERARLAREQANKERRFEVIKQLNSMWKEAEDLKRWKSIKSPTANALLRELKALS